MRIGNLKQNNEGIYIGRVASLTFSAVLALREVHSNNEKAPAFDLMALSSDRTTWVKVGAVWEYHSNETGEVFFSGRIDDPSLSAPIDISLFSGEGESYDVAWRRPQRKRSAPPAAQLGEDGLPPIPAAGAGDDSNQQNETDNAGDGLGESTATTKGKGAAKKQKENA